MLCTVHERHEKHEKNLECISVLTTEQLSLWDDGVKSGLCFFVPFVFFVDNK
jgi:hypothetical protein